MVRVKLKHLDLFSGESYDYSNISKDVFKVESLLDKSTSFIKTHRAKMLVLTSKFRGFDLETHNISDGFKLKIPKSMNTLPYVAMMELKKVFDNSTGVKESELASTILAISTFHENNKLIDFDIESEAFLDFKSSILEMDVYDCLKAISIITNDYVESHKVWDSRFAKVSFTDPDYTEAGGDRLNAYYIIRDIKSICSTFNLNYYEAWQLPYGVLMIHKLDDATANAVQRDLSQIKERKLKRKR